MQPAAAAASGKASVTKSVAAAAAAAAAPSATSNTSKMKKKLTKSESLDCSDDNGSIPALGADNGLGRVLIGIRYVTSNSSLEVRVVRGENLRSPNGDQPPKSTHCSVIFLPDRTDPVTTAAADTIGGGCRWRGAFRFEKFPMVTAMGANQRCLQVQVHDAASGSAKVLSEATLLLSNWSHDEYERGVRVWKYLNGTQDTQRASNKEGNAFLTLSCRPDRFKLILHRIDDLHSRYAPTSASESLEFHVRMQAFLKGRGIIKESTLRGICSSPSGELNFFDAKFSVRLNKYNHGGGGGGGVLGALTIRLVLTRKAGGQEQAKQQQQQQQQQEEICWLDLGANVKRMDCRSLYQSVLENPSQLQAVSIRMNRPPMSPALLDPSAQQKHHANETNNHQKHET